MFDATLRFCVVHLILTVMRKGRMSKGTVLEAFNCCCCQETKVGVVNDALDGLRLNVPIKARALFSGNGFTSGGMTNISVNLAGAYITDLSQASKIGEEIGDSIIRKLQKNVRF